MMFDYYTYLIPLIIIGLNFWFTKKTIKKISEYVKVMFRAIPHLYGYLFFIYYLGQEHEIDTGYSTISLTIFPIPISLSIFLLRIIYWIKHKN